jgi:endoglucanase
MDESTVYDLNQAAITAIRNAGATSQYIFVEGNSWTGAAQWNVTNDSLKTLTDPQDMLIYEMHLYLDSDASGTHTTCASTTIGVDRAVGATNWLRQNGKLGIIGEFAGGNNADCMTAVKGLLDHLQTNSDVWLGAVWWAAGPWWGATQWSSFEPPSGVAYTYYDALFSSYKP